MNKAEEDDDLSVQDNVADNHANVSNKDVIVALDIIRTHISQRNLAPDTFYQLESQVMANLTQNVSQQTIDMFLKNV